jgi:hypothetical protein
VRAAAWITLDMLREKKACAEGMAWVKKNLPDGTEYREFIEKLEAGRGMSARAKLPGSTLDRRERRAA